MGESFTVEIPEATKNGDVLKYKLIVDGEREIYRVYDDFSWLLHNLRTDTRTQGIIYPPLPKSPIKDAKEAEKHAREQFGSASHVLPSDTFGSECKLMARFMKLLLKHPVLGDSRIIKDFLTIEEAPQSVQMKTSRVLKWSTSVTEKLKSGHKDISPFFEDERNKMNVALSNLKACNDSCSRMITSNNKLSIGYSDLAIDSLPEDATNEETTTTMKRFGAIFSKMYTDLQHVEQTLGEDESRTLGRLFSFYGAYYESLKESLYKRTCLLISFQDAAKTAEKAKPEKKIAAEEQKTVKEKEFEDFSHELKEEIVRFNRDRIERTHKAIVNFSRAQIKAAVDRHALLAKELNLLKNLPI